MEKITTELLQTIFTRANQYAITKYGNEPDKIILDSSGEIWARYDNYCCGSYDYEDEIITVDNLTEDLDAVAAERAKKLEEERLKQEEYNRQQKILREQREKEERRRKFNELKKEFGE
jgi:hypothetical protein